MPDASRPTCRCGFDRTHPMVSPVPHYGFWGWLMLLNGASWTPKKLTYRCRRCQQEIEVSRDPAELRAFR